tara:strand:+ start:4881 stop:5606 length:726 start_codon:yes stop_codon:yes gene_type:complete
MTFKATYLGSNGWIIEFNECKIIIDPWLKGDLVFPPGDWFFKGTLENEIPTPKNIDLILITQGLPDHCHIPSLKQFSKGTEIICPKSALKTLNKLEFESINIIKPGEIINFKGIDIEATSGAPVPNVENGYVIDNTQGSFYIEPHGFFDTSIKPRKLDAVITPTKNLDLPLVGPFVKGADVIPKLIKAFKPNYILSSTIGGEAKFSGFLNNFIKVEEFQRELNCKLIDLKTMETFEVQSNL